ncbi:MAG: lactate utilization protein [Rhizobiaceae bacterium]|nr:lactate utilization protein [Rhizobiaceae bacterium]MCV0406121.1 lactate utilization protein [Rhizobiaceae bacterium]
MSAREAILSRIRQSLDATGDDGARRAAVGRRLSEAPRGVIPARGQLDAKARTALFCEQAEKIQATVQRVKSPDAVPKAVAGYLRSKNLPATIRMGADERLASMPWSALKSLEVRSGPSDGDDEAGLSHATAGVAETGTLVLTSGTANPTTINFLPEHHIVVIDAADIAGDLESALAAVRVDRNGATMPRTVNLISGPSRSGDIEQKLLLGAHGPRALHIIVVGG